MKKHSVLEYVSLWFSNWKFRRLLPVNLARNPIGRNADLFDLPFVAFAFWGMVAGDLLNNEKISAAVILVGAPWTIKQWDEDCEWVEKMVKEHPEWGV